MINLRKKTQKWVDSHLISKDQQKAILNHEDKQFVPFVLFGFIWLGLFCIGLGCISLITAYWPLIPSVVKLIGVALFLVTALGVAVYALYQKKHLIAETALFFAFLMIGGGIGLIAQIFNLPVGGARGLLLWAFLSLGIVLISKRELLLLLWIPLFLGGIIGFMRLELLLLFFEQSPLFATTLLGGFLFAVIYLCHFFENRWARSFYKWAIALYFPVVFLGDISMHTVAWGFLLSLFFLLLLAAFAIWEKRITLFNITGFFIAARLILFYFQGLTTSVFSGIGFLLIGIALLGVMALWFFTEKKLQQKEFLSTDNTSQ